MNKRLLLSSITVMTILIVNIGVFYGVVWAEPGTLYVDDNYNASTPGWGISHFNKIQDAVDTAVDGDTINVYEGSYFESVNVTGKDDLTFIAEKGGKPVKSVIIDADGDYAFEIRKSNGIAISGFKITDADSGFRAHMTNYSSFINNHIEDCWQYAAYITGSHNKIVGNYIMNTSGIHCYVAGGDMIGNVISKNTILKTESWGISLNNAVNCSITHNFISNASVGIDMGYLYGDCSRNVIAHNEISDVIRGIKFEPHVYSGWPTKMENNVISRNYIHNITGFPGFPGIGIDIQYNGGGVAEYTHILHNKIENSNIGIRNQGDYGKVHHNKAINCVTDYVDSGTANVDFKNSWNP